MALSHGLARRGEPARDARHLGEGRSNPGRASPGSTSRARQGAGAHRRAFVEAAEGAKEGLPGQQGAHGTTITLDAVARLSPTDRAAPGLPAHVTGAHRPAPPGAPASTHGRGRCSAGGSRRARPRCGLVDERREHEREQHAIVLTIASTSTPTFAPVTARTRRCPTGPGRRRAARRRCRSTRSRSGRTRRRGDRERDGEQEPGRRPTGERGGHHRRELPVSTISSHSPAAG